MNFIVNCVARYAAIKAVKRDLQARGLKPHYLKSAAINAAADAYLRMHPELIVEAAERVRNDPTLRKLAERNLRL